MPDVIINGVSYEEKFWFRSIGVLVGVYLYRREESIETDLPLEFVWKVGSKSPREIANLVFLFFEDFAYRIFLWQR